MEIDLSGPTNRDWISRRAFLVATGVSASSVLLPSPLQAADKDSVLFASACLKNDGTHCVLFFDENLGIKHEFALPSRGHEVVFSPTGDLSVTFARRPGTFALVFDHLTNRPPQLIHSSPERHFYGHGVFSNDGKLLFATENAYELAEGRIGIYDATGSFAKIGEFDSGGCGPHQILMMPDGKTLVVANGGIETHPDFGREKLNLATMKPSITFIDSTHGSLVSKHELPDKLHQLSLRHMAIAPNRQVFVGAQFEGSKRFLPPLVGELSVDSPLEFWPMEDETLSSLKNYIGSVAVSPDGETLSVTAPKGGVQLLMSTATGNIVSSRKIPAVFGTTHDGDRFFNSTSEGYFDTISLDGSGFDNHLSNMRTGRFGTG